MRKSASNIRPAITGDVLLEAMKHSKDKRKMIVEGLIYEKTMTMAYSDPGVGKSTITTQMAIEMAAGLPVFGHLEVPEPVPLLYIQAERDIHETIELINTMSKVLPILKDNITVTDSYQPLNLLNPFDKDIFIQCVKRDCPKAKLIIIDPIYATVSGGLKDDVPATAFTMAMRELCQATGASTWYNHHTSRPAFDKGVEVKRKVSFYGSRWLDAHCTGMFEVIQTGNGVSLIKSKDNYTILHDKIELDYNHETGLSSMSVDKLSALEKVRNYIKMRRIDGKTFYFNDIKIGTQLSNRSVREAVLHSSIKDSLIVVSSFKNKNLYKSAPL